MSFFTAKRLPFLAIVAAIPFCQLLSLCSSPPSCGGIDPACHQDPAPKKRGQKEAKAAPKRHAIHAGSRFYEKGEGKGKGGGLKMIQLWGEGGSSRRRRIVTHAAISAWVNV